MLNENLLKEVKKMSLYLFGATAVMLAVFAIFGYFGIDTLLGALLGYAIAMLNFYLLAVTVSKSVDRGKNGAQKFVGLSYTLRMIIIAAAVVFAIKSPYINYVAAVIPFVFPRIIILIDNLRKKKKGDAA